MAFVLEDSNGNHTTIGGVQYGGSVSTQGADTYTYDSEFQPVVDYQTAMNQLAVSSAKDTWAAQVKADEIAMQFEASEAQKLRDWQTEMSNTSYQRAVADMKKAGINPILAASNGGASTPAGAAGSGFTSSRQAPQLNLENVVATFKKLSKELEQSGLNANTAANAQKWSAGVTAVGNLLGSVWQFASKFGSFIK